MGIYIKGMEMPKNCYICDDMFLLSTIKCECPNFVLNERPSNCPLIEVPESHGRLIDADALANDLEADGKEFGDEMKLNCASWLRSNATPTVIEGSEVEE